MPLDFTNAPSGIAEYAALIENLTNEQLFERIAAWPDREEARKILSPQFVDALIWSLRVEIAELRARLGTWMAVERFVLRPYSGFDGSCPKCGAKGKGVIKAIYHEGPEPDWICNGTIEEGREHLHRSCKPCGYEWLEACAP